MHGSPRTNSAIAARDALISVIHPQPHLRRVAVRLHIDDAVGPVDVAPSDQVQGWLTAPIGAVKIECVLASPPIVADQAFLVDIRQIALAARIAGKIEHVPYERFPEKFAAAQG